MAVEIMIRKDGKEDGPYSKEQVQTMLDQGQLRRTDMAFHDGLSNWMPVAAVIAPRTTPPPYAPKTKPSESAITSIAASPAVTTPHPGEEINHKQEPSTQTLASPLNDSQKPIPLRAREHLEKTLAGFGGAELKEVLGFSSILKDKPWQQSWVRWLLCFSVIPAFLLYLANAGQLNGNEMSLMTGAYFS